MLVFTPVRRREWPTDTPVRRVMDIIPRRDIIEDIGRPQKDGVPIIINEHGITVTTRVVADRRHDDEFGIDGYLRPAANPVGTGAIVVN